MWCFTKIIRLLFLFQIFILTSAQTKRSFSGSSSSSLFPQPVIHPPSSSINPKRRKKGGKKITTVTITNSPCPPTPIATLASWSKPKRKAWYVCHNDISYKAELQRIVGGGKINKGISEQDKREARVVYFMQNRGMQPRNNQILEFRQALKIDDRGVKPFYNCFVHKRRANGRGMSMTAGRTSNIFIVNEYVCRVLVSGVLPSGRSGPTVEMKNILKLPDIVTVIKKVDKLKKVAELAKVRPPSFVCPHLSGPALLQYPRKNAEQKQMTKKLYLASRVGTGIERRETSCTATNTLLGKTLRSLAEWWKKAVGLLVIVDCEGPTGPKSHDCGATVVNISKTGNDRFILQRTLFEFPAETGTEPDKSVPLNQAMVAAMKERLDTILKDSNNRVMYWGNGPEEKDGGILKKLTQWGVPNGPIVNMFDALKYLWRRYGILSSPTLAKRMSFSMFILNGIFSPGVKYEHKGLSDCQHTAVPVVGFMDYLVQGDRYLQLPAFP